MVEEAVEKGLNVLIAAYLSTIDEFKLDSAFQMLRSNTKGLARGTFGRSPGLKFRRLKGINTSVEFVLNSYYKLRHKHIFNSCSKPGLKARLLRCDKVKRQLSGCTGKARDCGEQNASIEGNISSMLGELLNSIP